MRGLAALLRVAIGLDRTHGRRVASVRARADDDLVLIEAMPTVGSDVDLEIHTANERSSLLGEVVDRPVEVVMAGARPTDSRGA